MTGLEPATSGVTGRHSNQLSYTRAFPRRTTEAFVYGQAPNGSRTLDLQSRASRRTKHSLSPCAAPLSQRCGPMASQISFGKALALSTGHAHLIDGKAIAAALRATVRDRALRFQERAGRAPGLAAILVGDDPASDVYVANKARAAAEAGFVSDIIRLPAATSQEALAEHIAVLNARADMDGVLLQLPLPAGLDASPLVQAIIAHKDVDGFTYAAAGRVFVNAPREASGTVSHVPCTPLGCMRLIREGRRLLGHQHDSAAPLNLAGQRAVVVGRSPNVGLPMAALLIHANATVSVAHSRTPDTPAMCREADILCVAAGRPHLVRGDWIKPGAIVIDIGLHRVPAPEREAAKGPGASKLVGDVAFHEAVTMAGAITPAPGGVGPMTVACLLANTMDAAEATLAQG